MSTKPTSLTDIVVRPDKETVEHIEKLLEQAKTGELRGLAYVAVWQGFNVNSGWVQVPKEYFRTIMGELVILGHELLESELEHREP